MNILRPQDFSYVTYISMLPFSCSKLKSSRGSVLFSALSPDVSKQTFSGSLWSGDSSAPSSIPMSSLDWSAHTQWCVDEAAVGCSACYTAKMKFKCDSSGRWSRFPLWLPLRWDAHLASSWTNLHFPGIKSLLQRDPARPTRAPRHSCTSL